MKRRDLQSLLKAHARSFALTLRLLPKQLREPLSLAYLLARASDTVADASEVSRERRLKNVSELKMISEEGEIPRWKPEFTEEEISESEKELLDFTPQLMALLERSEDRAELLRLWQTILKGQLFDLMRFVPEAPLLTREELEEYCYLVAGSVGETWTQLISRYSPQTLLLPKEEMVKMGIAYGKGLQLLNILRDRAADRELGRMYIMEESVSEMMDLAAGWLDQGEDYCIALRPGRIRYASELPLRLARRTLYRIRNNPHLTRVKIPRREVYTLLLQTLPSLVLRSPQNPAS